MHLPSLLIFSYFISSLLIDTFLFAKITSDFPISLLFCYFILCSDRNIFVFCSIVVWANRYPNHLIQKVDTLKITEIGVRLLILSFQVCQLSEVPMSPHSVAIIILFQWTEKIISFVHWIVNVYIHS